MGKIYGGYTDRQLAAGAVGVTPKSAVTNEFLTAISAAGIASSARPAMANVSDYEAGTWTPTDASGAGLTLGAVSATYERIGRLVIARAHLVYPSTVNGTAAKIGGLPYAAGNTDDNRQAVLSQTSTSTAGGAKVLQNTTTITIRAANLTSDITNANASTNTFVLMAIYYI